MEPIRDELCGFCGVVPCEWEHYSEELWLAGARMKRKLVRRKRCNKVLRKTLGRYYLYLREGSLQGVIPHCVTRKFMEYWPDKRTKVTGSSVGALKIASSESLNHEAAQVAQQLPIAVLCRIGSDHVEGRVEADNAIDSLACTLSLVHLEFCACFAFRSCSV